MIRPFEIRDIPLLHRYRRRGLFLDSIPTLTWGRTLVPMGAAFSAISPATGVFTSICREEDDPDSQPVLGQVTHAAGAAFAHFTFLAPDVAIESPALAELLEHLIQQVGARRAQSLVAEVDEKSQIFEALRRAAFNIYSRQRIWRLTSAPAATGKSAWRPARPLHEFDQRRLYNLLVPALVQQVEPEHGRGQSLLLYQEEELRAFGDVHRGPRGVWLRPFIHPEMEAVGQHLGHLLAALRPSPRRPVYVCLRSYSAWLASALEDLGAEPGPAQAVMVRRLASEVRKPALQALPAINGGAEPVQQLRPDSPLRRADAGERPSRPLG